MKELLLFRHRANIHPDSIPVKTTAESTTRFLSDALPTNGRILNNAAAWNDQPMGTRWPRRYHGIDLAGRECFNEGTFNPVLLHQNQPVLVVLQDLTDHMRLGNACTWWRQISGSKPGLPRSNFLPIIASSPA